MITFKTKLQGFVGVSLRDPLNFYILKALMITYAKSVYIASQNSVVILIDQGGILRNLKIKRNFAFRCTT